MEDRETPNQTNENQVKLSKRESNQLKGGEAFLGVLKDEEEKKEEELEQKMREEKEFKKFETEMEEDELKQDEEIIKIK